MGKTVLGFKVIDELVTSVKACAGDAAGAVGDVAEEAPREPVDGFEMSL